MKRVVEIIDQRKYSAMLNMWSITERASTLFWLMAGVLAICFNGVMAHGLLPESMLSVALLPVIKDKAGKVGSLDNFRPIALAWVLSKVLERILLDRFWGYLGTTYNQFGFKTQHSTDLCIYALKKY